MRRPLAFFALLLCVALLLPACQRAYYGTMEKFGFQKREILTSRVEKARDAQEEAGEQFRSALDRFRSVVEIDGGELEEKYDTLQSTFDESRERAEEVRERIDSVEDVAEALFEEWEEELEKYQDPQLRSKSRRKLNETRSLYSDLIVSMRAAEDRMEPVLAAFQDQVLYLKHNLNAQAIASLCPELVRIENDVDRLIEQMNRAIRDADAFIRQLEAS